MIELLASATATARSLHLPPSPLPPHLLTTRHRNSTPPAKPEMELTESSYLSSPDQEQQRKRSPSPPSDSKETPTYIKFLVSNAAAGSVIGKGGANISDFQSQSGARIQLSRNFEFFPGTSDRIVMISGAIDDVLSAVELILAKLLSELHAEDGNDSEPRMKVRLIVPNGSCGSIIGKGGSIIKSFIESSQAVIKISPLDTNFYGLIDRLVTVAGTLEAQMTAFDLILSKLSEDSQYLQNMHTPFSYAGVFSGVHGYTHAHMPPPVATAAYNSLPYNSMNYGSNGAGEKFQNSKEDRSNSVTIGVADEHIGLVLGRGGRNIMEISQLSGARIKISDRGDFLPGTTDRKVTITGSQRAIHSAEGMITQKVASASERGPE